MGTVSRLARSGSARYILIAAIAGLCGFAVLAISLSERSGAAFPGLNGRIAFSNGQSYVSQSIYSVNSDGSSPTGLTSATNDYSPRYSADGSKIAFNRQNSIVVMNADGSGAAQIATGTKSENATTKWQANYEDPHSPKVVPEVKIETRMRSAQGFYSPAFTPDGAQLVVSEYGFDRIQEEVCAVENEGDTECIGYSGEGAYFDYNFECHECFQHIVTISSTTGAVTSQVTPKTEAASDFSPAVSADGKIAFVRDASGSASGSGIFVVNSPGAAPTQLTSGYGNYGPDFSPDSSRIIFSHGQREFGVIGVGGGPIALITLPPPPAGSYEYVDSPKYSPDGSQIVFYRSFYHPPSTEEHGIFVMGSDGSNPHRISDGYDPDWQPVLPPPPPTPATGKAKKGKVKLNKKGQGVVGTITCGSSPCTLKALSALLKVHQPSSKGKKKGHAHNSSASRAKGKARTKTYKVKVGVAKALAPGRKAPVKVTVKGKALAALRKAHKGTVTVKVQVTDALGKKVVALRATLIPSKQKKHKKHKKSHK
jgi:WD40-like Beta Propeller Repeat